MYKRLLLLVWLLGSLGLSGCELLEKLLNNKKRQIAKTWTIERVEVPPALEMLVQVGLDMVPGLALADKYAPEFVKKGIAEEAKKYLQQASFRFDADGQLTFTTFERDFTDFRWDLDESQELLMLQSGKSEPVPLRIERLESEVFVFYYEQAGQVLKFHLKAQQAL
jgi:hypothetical protein